MMVMVRYRRDRDKIQIRERIKLDKGDNDQGGYIDLSTEIEEVYVKRSVWLRLCQRQLDNVDKG